MTIIIFLIFLFIWGLGSFAFYKFIAKKWDNNKFEKF